MHLISPVIVTIINDVHPENAEDPMDVTLSGIDTEIKLSLSLKQLSPIDIMSYSVPCMVIFASIDNVDAFPVYAVTIHFFE